MKGRCSLSPLRQALIAERDPYWRERHIQMREEHQKEG